jgi:hypothetical protein
VNADAVPLIAELVSDAADDGRDSQSGGPGHLRGARRIWTG